MSCHPGAVTARACRALHGPRLRFAVRKSVGCPRTSDTSWTRFALVKVRTRWAPCDPLLMPFYRGGGFLLAFSSFSSLLVPGA
ncbi:hypothetical protein LY76DRAFT_251696 [Colletotrichum caudatum]|nr:hypothetical protein LY76DRAFT_251696 [Colletotrichum caudatum]